MRRTHKKKYTVLPKTVKETKMVRTKITRKVNCFLNKTSKKLKKIPKTVDRRTSKSIRRFMSRFKVI